MKPAKRRVDTMLRTSGNLARLMQPNKTKASETRPVPKKRKLPF